MTSQPSPPSEPFLDDDPPMWEDGLVVKQHNCPDCACAQRARNGTISDGYQDFIKCERGASCGLEIVRIGKVQCWCDTEDRERFKCSRGHYVEPCYVCGEPSQCGELTCAEHDTGDWSQAEATDGSVAEGDASAPEERT